MKRPWFAVSIAAAVFLSGCKDKRVDELVVRVTTLETSLDSLKTEHTKTREKLQALLIWTNKRTPPEVGLVDWIEAVNRKLWPGPTDPIKPSDPPPPF